MVCEEQVQGAGAQVVDANDLRDARWQGGGTVYILANAAVLLDRSIGGLDGVGSGATHD